MQRVIRTSKAITRKYTDQSFPADPRLFIKPNKPHRMRENPWNEHFQQDDYTGGHDET